MTFRKGQQSIPGIRPIRHATETLLPCLPADRMHGPSSPAPGPAGRVSRHAGWRDGGMAGWHGRKPLPDGGQPVPSRKSKNTAQRCSTEAPPPVRVWAVMPGYRDFWSGGNQIRGCALTRSIRTNEILLHPLRPTAQSGGGALWEADRMPILWQGDHRSRRRRLPW